MIELDAPAPDVPAQQQYLTAPGMTQAVASLSTQYAVAAAKAAAVLAQPDLSMSLIQTLPEDLALLRTHAAAFRDGDALAGGIFAGMEAVATIAEAVSDLANELTPTAQRIDAASPGDGRDRDLAVFRAALDSLRVRVTALDPDRRGAARPLAEANAALSTFAAGPLADDLTRFRAAAAAVRAADVLHRLEGQVADVQGRIDELNHQVAEGATSQILPSLSFGFAIMESAFMAETDAGGAVLGVGFAIKDEAEGASAFAEEMRRKDKELHGLIAQYRGLVEGLVGDEQEMAVLLTVSGHATGFQASVAAAAGAVQATLDQVTTLGRGIDELTLLDDGSGVPDFFTGQVQAAAESWTAVGQAARDQLTLARSVW